MTCKAARCLQVWPCVARLGQFARGRRIEALAARSCDHWRATRAAIYELENRIAFLEADPEIDDGYKAPIIVRARADICGLRATLPAGALALGESVLL